ncbi:MAG: hypothetical protein JSV84_09065 [Gemmatimonadota bacterium]|nr:MAG: hypothetical protein JSV84_09065 [Gemmatimonadota bacterium]
MEESLKFNMWHVLKADLQYHRLVIGTVYTIGIMMLIGDLALNIFDIYMILGITTLSFYAGMWIIGATDNKEKRDRHQTALPNSIERQSTVRLMFCVLFQTGLLIMWLLLLLLKYAGDANRLVWDIFSINALNLIIIMLFVIYADLGEVGKKLYRYLFLGSVLLILFFLIYLSIIDTLQYPLSFGPEIRKTPVETAVYNIVCIVLIYFDHIIFLKRRSYLD